MKKIFTLFVPLLVLIGCTLSIEDEIPAPEEVGFDEPVTVENEYGSLTYQFNDSVLYVTERVQEHITMIDDSTLFYDASTPKEWRPYVGSKLAAGVSHLIPGGLNNRVVSVTQQDGGYLVKTQRTTIEDVYKSLSYDFDFDSNVPYVDPDASDEELAEMGMERLSDSTIMCWNVYDEMRAKALGLEEPQTRATASKDTLRHDEHFNMAFTVTKQGYNVLKGAKQLESIYSYLDALSSACRVADGVVDAKGSALGNVSIGLNLEWSTHTHTHISRNEDTDFEENITDQYSTFAVGAELKFSKDIISGGAASEAQKIGDYKPDLNNADAIKVLNEGLRDALKTTDSGKIKMPSVNVKFGFFLTPVPFNFVFSAETNFQLNINAVMGVKGSYQTDTQRSGYIISNGQKTIIDEVTEKGHFSFDNFYVQGGFKAAVGGRIGIGAELAGSVGVDVGANLELGLEANMGVSYARNQDEEYAWDVDGKVRFYCDFFVDMHVFVAPFGIDLFDEQIAVFLKKTLFEYTSEFNPKIGYLTSFAIPEFNDNISIHAMYGMKNTGMLNYFFSSGYYPYARLYYGEYDPNSENYELMLPANKSYEVVPDYFKAQAGEDYYFKWVGALPEGVYHCTVVPCVLSGSQNFVFPEYKQTVETSEPDVSIVAHGTKQTYGGVLGEFDLTNGEVNGYIDQNADGSGYGASVDPSTLRLYKFATEAAVRNGSYLSSWGIKVEVFTPEGKRSVRKKIPMNPNKTGIYTLVCSFYTNWQKVVSGDPVPMHFRVTPYWVDSGGVSHEGKASAKLPIEYDCADITPETKIGFVVEKDL